MDISTELQKRYEFDCPKCLVANVTSHISYSMYKDCTRDDLPRKAACACMTYAKKHFANNPAMLDKARKFSKSVTCTRCNAEYHMCPGKQLDDTHACQGHLKIRNAEGHTCYVITTTGGNATLQRHFETQHKPGPSGDAAEGLLLLGTQSLPPDVDAEINSLEALLDEGRESIKRYRDHTEPDLKATELVKVQTLMQKISARSEKLKHPKFTSCMQCNGMVIC